MKKMTKYVIFLVFIIMISMMFSDSAFAGIYKYDVLKTCNNAPTVNSWSKDECERLEPDCAWLLEMCLATQIEPDPNKPCAELKYSDDCQMRKDCKWTYPKTIFSKGSCGKNPYYNEEIDKRKNGNNDNSTDITDIVKPVTKKVTCSDIKFVTGAWLVLRVLAPFVVILFGSLDFLKAVLASDEKKMKEARGKFPKRLIAFILLIVLPFIVQFIFNNIGTYGSQNTCLLKCIITNDTSSKGCE